MDTIQAATTLRTLLVSHDKAVKHISILDQQVEIISAKIVSSPINHSVRRRCILEPLRALLTCYKNRKWQQVQACVVSITNAASRDTISDDSDSEEEVLEQFEISSDGPISVDADVYSGEVVGLVQSLCRDSCERQRSG